MSNKRIFRFPIFAVLLLILLSVFIVGSVGAQGNDGDPAPLMGTNAANVIPNMYIVVYKEGAQSAAANAAAISAAVKANGGRVDHVYDAVLNGYSAYLTPKALKAVRANPMVAYVEADAMAYLTPGGDNPEPDEAFLDLATQVGVTWGIDRVDQRSLPLNNKYIYNTGAWGVHAYVIDTGIRTTHSEFGFGTRASLDVDFINDGSNDCHGHGTHVAGTIGGTTYGVAKNVRLHGVRVFDCSGGAPWSQIIAGINWVALNHIKPAVANLSLGGLYIASANTAVTQLHNLGVTVVVSAGNSGADACGYSPASAPAVITVGATTSNDFRWSGSNWGPCLDLFAPGYLVTSAWILSDYDTHTISGTSMAAPHVTGAAALYLKNYPGSSPDDVWAGLKNAASVGKVLNEGVGSTRRLLYTRDIPMPIKPVGKIFDLTPTYQWTKVKGATNYNYRLKKGVAVVYSKYVTAAVCGTSTCSKTPATTLGYFNYTWQVRAKVDDIWGPWSPLKAFSLSKIPVPISPTGEITDTTPKYFWEKVPGATVYDIQLWQGATLVYDTYPTSGACGLTTCNTTPGTALPFNFYKWRARAKVGGVWQSWSTYKFFKVTKSGFDSPFNLNKTGWNNALTNWSIYDASYLRSFGQELKMASTYYNYNWTRLQYEAKMKRFGCDYCANSLNIRGDVFPMVDGHWYSAYRFQYTNNGSFSVWKNDAGVYSSPSGGWRYDNAINKDGWNTLKVIADGSSLYFYINDIEVWAGTDPDLTSGKVGLAFYRDSSINNRLWVDWATLAVNFPAPTSTYQPGASTQLEVIGSNPDMSPH